MSEKNDEQSGFILWLSQQALPIRIISFFVFVVLIVGLIIGATIGLYYVNVSNFPRLVPFALDDTVSVYEFAVLEDEEAYPSAIASASDGTAYTGSYISGAVWQILPNGEVIEMPDTRANIGSVIGIDVASDGTVYILDHLDPFLAGGAKIWQINVDGVTLHSEIAERGDISLLKPNDIVVSDDGLIFVLDISLGQILTVDAEGLSIWWQSPDSTYQIAGLAYNALNNSLMISDAVRTAIYEIPLNAENPEAERQIVYVDETTQSPPAFNGLSVGDDGTIYVAAFDLNEVWSIEPNTNTFTILANNYRGSSDVAYDSANQRLYVNNWDQSWLIPITLVVIQVDLPPRLPFSIDVIELNAE
ncbi:MAG: hypothetical protein Phog2KO_39720 [Phototrophicaceae bacterium]